MTHSSPEATPGSASEAAASLKPSATSEGYPSLPGEPDAPAGSVLTRPHAVSQRMAINQLTTLPWSLQQDLDEYRRHGIAGIGLHSRKLSETGIRRAIRRIQQSGLPVSSVGWAGGFTGEHGHALPDALAEARRLIRIAGQLRASTVTVITGPQAGHIRNHAVRLVVDALKDLSHLAEIYNVDLSLQPMHPLFQKNWSFVNSLDEALTVLDRVGDPRVKLAFGAYHLWEEPELVSRIGEIARRTGVVTLADWKGEPRDENDRLLPGSGDLPLGSLVEQFEEHGYSGWYELEVWSRDLWKLDQGDLMRKCLDAREQLSVV